jgi:adenosylcobinamide kinase/adenosylcobinamide-phosphate guanylyltransferase
MKTVNQTKKSGHIIYISGGCRSGKSAYAQKLAEASSRQKVYLATCPSIDAEMDQRIAIHQKDRAGQGWQTIEEPIDLAAALSRTDPASVVLIDCLTLWVNNLLFQAEQNEKSLTEEALMELSRKVLAACRVDDRLIVVVSNEVGMGLVPGDTLSRRYRDLIGRCNQCFAKAADEAIFMVSGLPLTLK